MDYSQYAPPLTIKQLYEKILERIEFVDDCWIWTGAKSKSGYGYWTEGFNKPIWRVHRFMWAITHNEEMPRTKAAKVVIDHICNNKLCCRPAHLQKISQRDNVRRDKNHDGTKIGYHLSTHKIIKDSEIKYYRRTYGSYPRCMTCFQLYSSNRPAWYKQRAIDRKRG